MSAKMLARKFIQSTTKPTETASRDYKTSSCLHCLSYQLHELSSAPNARGPPIIGAITSIVKSGGGTLLHEYIDKQHKKYGTLFRGRIGPIKAVFVSDPDTIRKMYSLEGAVPQSFVPEAWLLYNRRRQRARGLLFMNGEEWQTNRRCLNKVMMAQNSVDFMIEPCFNAASDLVTKWTKYTKGQIVPDLENQLYQLSIEVIIATLVGKSWPSYKSQILSELDTLSRKLSQIFEYSVELSRVPARLAEMLRLASWRGFVSTTDYCFDSVDRLVDGMMELKDAEDGMLARMLADGLDQATLRRIVVDLIFAAGDTTAFALQWLLFLLANNPESQENLHEAVRELDRKELLPNSLLRGAIKESLRLYPIAPFITRVMPHNNFLDRFLIEQGELVVMSVYTSGRSEAYFPRAHEFRPERWLRNEKGDYSAVKNPYASLPFSMGAKSCIGKRLAETQLSIVAAEILKNFKIDCLNKKNISIKLRMITAPSEPLQLQLTPRN